MKLLFLHGAPAAGKLTVAKALLRIVPGRLMDNHAAIDLALTVFDFGAPGFWRTASSSGRSRRSCNVTAQNCFRSSCTVRAKKPCAGSAIPTGWNGAR